MKTILATAMIGGVMTASLAGTLTAPINTNYTDTGTKLVTYVAANEIDISKTSPSVTLQKWNGQEKLNISVGNSSTASTPVGLTTEVDNNIGNGQTVKMQPTADGQGFNVDIVLVSKPTSNVFTYTFSGYDDMDFFYQAPLWQEAGLSQSTSTCTDTDCTLNGETSHRPINVVGSYAVYSHTHINHVIGQTNYETGKLFHIYRPLVTDTASSTVWATLGYSNGVLSITVPQSFLDSASYPVIIDPTFGYTTIGASSFAIVTGQSYAHMYSASESGTVTKLTTYLDNSGSSQTAHIKSLAYNDSSGYPNSLLAVSSEFTLAAFASGAWIDSTMSFSISNNTFHLGFAQPSTDTAAVYYCDTGSATQMHRVADSYSSPANPYPGSATTAARKCSIYATYTAGGGGGGSATQKHQVMIIN